MPLPPGQRLKFFVYIIESPSAPDLYHGRHEGAMLEQSLKLNQVSCVSRLVVKKDAFGAALVVGLPEAMKLFPGLIPIIHISAHGDADGLQLSDDSRVVWSELKAFLQPINKELNHSLIVCMSCCEGYSGIQMAMSRVEEDYPFFAIIGNYGKPTWAETSIAFSTLYHLVNKGELVLDAVKAMNIAAGAGSFVAERAEDTRAKFIEICSKSDVQKAQTILEQASQTSDAPELTKFSTAPKEANQTLVPTTPAVTPAADAPVAPAGVAAHL